MRTLNEILDRSVARTSFALVLLGIASVAALILGTIGIYGVISHIVSQRTRELGLRLASGARARDVSVMVLLRRLKLSTIGIAVGLGAALVLTRLIGSLLYGVDPVDPLTFAVTAISLTAVALAACFFPAHHASRVDPLEAIRSE